MKKHLAEVNIAKFIKPAEDPVNKDFIDNLDRVNATAEAAPGFVWRFIDDADNPTTIYNDPNVIVNLSVWQDLESLVDFAFKNDIHRQIMRRRKEWFERMDFYLALWWVEPGCEPTVAEAIAKIELIKQLGSTPAAFTFARPFSASGQETRILPNRCA